MIASSLSVLKRNQTLVPFDSDKIYSAIQRCAQSFYSIPLGQDYARGMTELVYDQAHAEPAGTISVERIQDIVEEVLLQEGLIEMARRYMHYRDEHARLRDESDVDEPTRASFDESASYFPTPIQLFQYYDKYSRFDYDLGRRETWVETVDRATDYLYELAGDRLEREDYERIRASVLEMRAMPSMRLLAMAGPAARRNNIAIYNCSYLPVKDVEAFGEALLISMSGCGVGFSVERKYVDQLPAVKPLDPLALKLVYPIADTTDGWQAAVQYGIYMWMEGRDVSFDYSQLRAAGAPLKIKGGRSSGPEPLRRTLDFVRAKILARQGQKLRPIDAHDIMCAVGNAAVSGGVRRTAMISLFDWDDQEMLHCKSGDFAEQNAQRWNANNSAVWESNDPNQLEFLQNFYSMVKEGRGEPGIFNRYASIQNAPYRRSREGLAECGTNPCGEIVLRPYEFCNLSIAVARPRDTTADLTEKVEIATIIGAIQSLATYFPGLRPDWAENARDERLLGVDITGQMDCSTVQTPIIQQHLKMHAINTARAYSAKLGINIPASVTTVKPSGNSAQLLNVSSGLHSRWARYYLRNVRVSATSPIYKILRDAAVPMSPEVGQSPSDAITWVIHFPMRSPEGSKTRNDRGAIEQCEYWLRNKLCWTEHNPSVTITYRPDEIMDLISWVWAHRSQIGGMSFLPSFDAQYDLLPYQEITEQEYLQRAREFPTIDFSKIVRYEHEDLTNAAQELACMSGTCELDI